jgi:hypothetical protein
MPEIAQNDPERTSLSGDFARIQTRVAPQNPYDNINRMTDPEINHSLDHAKHPIVIQKNYTHADYMKQMSNSRSASAKPNVNSHSKTTESN